MDDVIAGTTMSTNDFGFLCDDVMLVAMVTGCHRLILNRHSVLLCSNVSVDAVPNECDQLDDDLAADPSLDDLGNPDRNR